MFCASPNFLIQLKTSIAFSASSKTFVLAQKLNLLKFWSGTKNLDLLKIVCKRTRPIYDHFASFVNCVLLRREHPSSNGFVSNIP